MRASVRGQGSRSSDGGSFYAANLQHLDMANVIVDVAQGRRPKHVLNPRAVQRLRPRD